MLNVQTLIPWSTYVLCSVSTDVGRTADKPRKFWSPCAKRRSVKRPETTGVRRAKRRVRNPKFFMVRSNKGVGLDGGRRCFFVGGKIVCVTPTPLETGAIMLFLRGYSTQRDPQFGIRAKFTPIFIVKQWTNPTLRVCVSVENSTIPPG